ncbi:hypothetical protein OPQ81_008616 [Rhizoctonia solani]|nr:hypothetical protein OPQ81_008616 [Rhizoctonia solani]
MTHGPPDDAEINTENHVSLEEIKALAPRLEMAAMDEPEDSCIICLQPVEDRTVLPSCAHDRMCFECIKKWTEQSRKCPLCNTPIGSHLIHRIRSDFDYQKYFLEPLRSSPPPQHIVAEARAGYRARTRRPSQVEQDNLERAIEKRRWVYRHDLFAKHIASNPHTRFRPNPTPSQIANSPELQSRCQMFVRRELRVWPNLDVEFLTSFILSLAKSIDIRTESAVKLISEFLDINARPSPSGGTVAEHFVHELYSYLRSPFRDLPAYDAVVQYDTPDDIEPPPSTIFRSNTHRQIEAGPSRRPSGPSALDDPLDASPRDANSDSDMDIDDYWIELPPSRSGWRGEGGESGRMGGWDDESWLFRRDSQSSRRAGGESTRRDRDRVSRRGRPESRDREERRPRRARSPTLGRDTPPPSRREEASSLRRERSPVPTRERSPEPRRDKDGLRGRESRRHNESRSPPPTRDRKGKRRADEDRRRDRDRGNKERDDGRRESDGDGRDWKGKDKEGYEERNSRHYERKEHGAREGEKRRNHDDRKRWDSDERRWRDNDERRRDNDAETLRDNEEQKGKYNTLNRWNDDDERGTKFGSSAQFREEKAYRRRFSGSLRRYGGRGRDASPDQRPRSGDYDQRPSRSSRHRSLTDDEDVPHSSSGRSRTHEEPTSYKSGQAISPGSPTHGQHGSYESNKRPSKRARSSSPKSQREESARDQKRPAVDDQHVDDYSKNDSRRPRHSRSESSALPENIRSDDIQEVDDGAQQPSFLTRDTQTRSPSLSRRPASHHNVKEPKTPQLEPSSAAHHTVHPPFGLTDPGVDQALSTQPEDNGDKTRPDTRDKTQTAHRNRALRLTPLASIRAHLQGPSRPSEPLNEDYEIKGSPTRSATHPEPNATNYPHAPSSAPGPTLSPSAVEKSSMAPKDPNTNPIHISPGSNGSSVSYSILGAAARSQALPPLITASTDSTQRVCPDSTVGRNRLLLVRLEAIRAATNSDIHASHLSAKPPGSPTVPDTSGNQSATNRERDDRQVPASPNGQLGADPADINAPAARFQYERRLKLQARLAARKREINAVMDTKDATPR